jgi:hypothetical protein
MKSMIIAVTTIYCLYTIGKVLIKERIDQLFWEQEYENNTEFRDLLSHFKEQFDAGQSWSNVKKELGWEQEQHAQ